MKQTSKILGSVLVIAVASALVAVGTMAWFTGTDKIEGNIFGTGTLDIELTSPASLPFVVTDMAPGDPPVTDYLIITNTGSLDLQFRARVELSGDLDLANVLNVRVTLVETNEVGRSDLLYDGPLAGIVLPPWDPTNAPDWPFAPGWTNEYEIVVSLPTSVGDDYQGLSLEGTIVVEATQWGVAWDEAFPS